MQPVENRYSLPLKKEGLTLYRGWNDDVARQLVERSQEPEIKKFTHRDAAERFVSDQTASLSRSRRAVTAVNGYMISRG